MTTATLTGRVMDQATAAKLREPFKPYEVGKLPKLTCGKCSKAQWKVCEDHKKEKCRTCGNYLSTQHIHLDYVGHAEITDRLLQVDPEWSWEPIAWDANGLPRFDEHNGLWIRLTVAGVTRLGYGDAEGKTGPAARKETIGDALRNAAMRFGVGIDLWGAKHDEPETPASRDASPALDPVEAQRRAELVVTLTAGIEAANTPAELKAAWDQVPAPAEGKLSADEYNALAALTKQRRGQLETGNQDNGQARNEATQAAEPSEPDRQLTAEADRESNPGQWDTIAEGWSRLGIDDAGRLARIAEILDAGPLPADWSMAQLTFKQALKIMDWQTRQSWTGGDTATTVPGVTQQQHTQMHIRWGKLGYGGQDKRDARLDIINRIALRLPVEEYLTSSKQLTFAQAQTVIAKLDDRIKAKAAEQTPVGASA